VVYIVYSYYVRCVYFAAKPKDIAPEFVEVLKDTVGQHSLLKYIN